MEKASISKLFAVENGFFWLGEWQPLVTFHVAYAELGQQLESELSELLKGINLSNLAGLTSTQLLQINELHCRTVQDEDKLAHRLTALQRIAVNSEGFERDFDGMSKELQCILVVADKLRVDTLKRLLDFLTPCQCIQTLVPALRLQFCLHGKK